MRENHKKCITGENIIQLIDTLAFIILIALGIGKFMGLLQPVDKPGYTSSPGELLSHLSGLAPTYQWVAAISWALASACFSFYRTLDENKEVQLKIRRDGINFLRNSVYALVSLVFYLAASNFLSSGVSVNNHLIAGGLSIDNHPVVVGWGSWETIVFFYLWIISSLVLLFSTITAASFLLRTLFMKPFNSFLQAGLK